MSKYNQSKIYKIEPICEHEENEIYIGSTTKKYLSQRIALHKCCYKKWKNNEYHNVSVFELFDKYGVENCNIVLLEQFKCEDVDELRAKEKEYIKTMNCINKYIPNGSKKEYYQENKIEILEKNKEYYQENKIELLEKFKEYRQENHDKILKYEKEYREVNKEAIKEKQGQKVNCECGCIVSKSNMARHLKTPKHLDFLKINA